MMSCRNYTKGSIPRRIGEKLVCGRPGFEPGRVETSGSVSVNHSLTGPRCKNGISECMHDKFECIGPVGM